MPGIASHIKNQTAIIRGEAQALADILTWSKGLPGWQRDALRRLCIKGEIDNADLDELMLLCKKKSVGCIELAAQHIPDPEADSTVVNLVAIHGTENVNALKPDQSLTFDRTGLTVIYGDNGSGKSGYVRILKQVCRARMPSKGEKILPNIYKRDTDSPKAVIEFNSHDNQRSHAWAEDKPVDPLLSSVSVFDNRAASVYVNKANDVAYTPFSMLVLERLAETCQKIKERIKMEIRQLRQQTPDTITHPKCNDETAVYKLISGLSHRTEEQDVYDLATFNDQDKAQLAMLRADLAKDPAKAARQAEALKNRLENINEAFDRFQKVVEHDKVRRLISLYHAHQTAQKAAAVAADVIFADDPLPNIGSDVWCALWEAARRYSRQRAYPDMSFPFTDDGARCVLCHQELDADAVERFNRFASFIMDESKRKEEEAATAYRAALDEMNAAENLATILGAVAVVRHELDDRVLAKLIRRTEVTLKWRLRAIRRNHMRDDTNGSLPEAEGWPADKVSAHITSLSERIIALRAEDASEKRMKIHAEFEELAARDWLAVIQGDVIAEINRRKAQFMLKETEKEADTTRITKKSGQLAEQLVTAMLRKQFSKEIEKLGVTGLAVELRRDRTSYGVPYFRIRLIQNSASPVGNILSEGEHQCVALAAFLAELTTAQSRSAIVFDDPVSSLDHIHRQKVADRLAEEGLHRQVIVFTHDIAFQSLLDQACHRKNTHVAFRSMTRTADYAGLIRQNQPMHVQSSTIRQLTKTKTPECIAEGDLKSCGSHFVNILDNAHEKGFLNYVATLPGWQDSHKRLDTLSMNRASEAMRSLHQEIKGDGPDYEDVFIAGAYQILYHLRHCNMAFMIYNAIFDKMFSHQFAVPDLFICDVGAGSDAGLTGLLLALKQRNMNPYIRYISIEPSDAMHEAGCSFLNNLNLWQEYNKKIDYHRYRNLKEISNLKQLRKDKNIITAFHLSLKYNSRCDNHDILDVNNIFKPLINSIYPDTYMCTCNINKTNHLEGILNKFSDINYQKHEILIHNPIISSSYPAFVKKQATFQEKLHSRYGFCFPKEYYHNPGHQNPCLYRGPRPLEMGRFKRPYNAVLHYGWRTDA